jgi:hypothetical protein
MWVNAVVIHVPPLIGRDIQYGNCGMSSAIVGVVADLEGSLLTIFAKCVVAFAGRAAIWKDYYICH